MSLHCLLWDCLEPQALRLLSQWTRGVQIEPLVGSNLRQCPKAPLRHFVLMIPLVRCRCRLQAVQTRSVVFSTVLGHW